MKDDGSFIRPWSGSGDSGGVLDVVYCTTDVFFSPSARDFFARIFQAQRLDWFQSSAAGLDAPILRQVGRKAGIYTSGHEHAAAISEWVLWAALEHFQGGPARRAAQAREEWAYLPFRELSETRWVIVGFGHIGREVARRLRWLGAHVTGVRRTPGPDVDADAMVAPDEIQAALGEADAVLLCLPLTPDTERLASTDFFAAMMPGALFLNVGRGKLVDEAALLAGLDAGRPGHASLDVTVTEPLPEGHPIWQHPQITLTPHISAQTQAARVRTDALFLDNLEAYLTGAEMKNLIEKSVFLDD